ncbi:hypothetical protein E4U53_002633 [Claviceps sorghi]|nr:hypothetical protein E4U53_002633 [Claviceps sorghi]
MAIKGMAAGRTCHLDYTTLQHLQSPDTSDWFADTPFDALDYAFDETPTTPKRLSMEVGRRSRV